MSRFWEIDLARAVAVLMMVAYHAAYDVWFLAPSVDIDPFGGGWRALQVITGSSFLFVVGVSLAVSNARYRARGLTGAALWRRHARRAAQVMGAALLVSLVTRVALGPEDYIRFGVLHCIAVAMLVLPLLVRLPPWLVAALAVPVIVAGKALEGATSDVPGLLIPGWRPEGGAGVDYYPLLPWLGPALLGLAAGMVLYPGGERAPRLARVLRDRHLPGGDRLTWPGRHALPVYLVHQPMLIVVVAVVLTLLGVTVDPEGR